jgi:serine/tyrosine/threonine adenylyltransferase
VVRCFHLAFLARLGLQPVDAVRDALFVSRCVCFLEKGGASFDRFFFDWSGGVASDGRAAQRAQGPNARAYQGEPWTAVRKGFDERAPAHPERLTDAYFAADGPCTLLIDDVEAVWVPIAVADDWGPFEAKIAAIRAMPRG